MDEPNKPELPRGAADFVPPSESEIEDAATVTLTDRAAARQWWNDIQPPDLKDLLDD